jgi:hypothetical protein
MILNLRCSAAPPETGRHHPPTKRAHRMRMPQLGGLGVSVVDDGRLDPIRGFLADR